MNISTEFKSYIEDTINLSRSMVIKSSMIAQYINNWMSALNNNPNLDEEPASEWKYYVNLTGNYYSSPGYSDTPMMIQSLDNGNTILFSPENLSNNPVTQKNYYPGSFFYNQLVTLYPLQQDLILSIIYPTDINTALNSKDGTILGYNTSLVEPQEYTLISKIQEWIYGFEFRWNVKGYSVSDEYYPAAYRAILYNQIVNKLLNLRLLNCKTPEVNSFHIRHYLDSNNDLGQYIPYLSLEQQLYLYRNINSFRLKSGYKSVFKNLLNNIAIPSKVNIYGIDLVKSSTATQNPPLSSFKLTAINDVSNANGYKDNIVLNTPDLSLNEVLSLESPLTTNNPHYIEKYSSLISDKTQYTLDNTYDTKLLYSTNIELTTPFDFTLNGIIYNELIYLSYTKKYNAIGLLELSTNQFYYLSAINVVYLLRYLAAEYYNINIPNLPTLYCQDVLRPTSPTYEQASSVVNNNDAIRLNLEVVYNDIISLIPNQFPITNINKFYSYCSSIFDLKKKMYYYTAAQGNANDRAYMSAFFKQFFSDYSLPPIESQTYNEWLISLGINTTSYTSNDYYTLYNQVLNSITTLDQNTVANYADTVNAIVDIIKSLTSYTLQYIVNIVTNIETVGDKIVRVYDFYSLFTDDFYYELSTLLGEIIYPDMYRVANTFNLAIDESIALSQTYSSDYQIVDSEDIPVSNSKYDYSAEQFDLSRYTLLPFTYETVNLFNNSVEYNVSTNITTNSSLSNISKLSQVQLEVFLTI